MNYYIKGDAANADQIKAAFERLGYDTRNLDYSCGLFITFNNDRYVHFLYTDSQFVDIIKTHPDYQELELPTKPKFKVGDTIQYKDNTYKIIGIHYDTQQYLVDGGTIGFAVQDSYHLWTIQDAKDGDVLALNGKPFIYSHNKYGKNYCYIDDCGQFRVNFNLVLEGNCVCPATKQERDLLFSKMREVGYEWDSDKKELKRSIKPKFKLHDIIMRKGDLYSARTIMYVNNENMTYRCSCGKDIPFSEQDLWHLSNSHYFIQYFKPKQWVLVRDCDNQLWGLSIFSHRDMGCFICINRNDFRQCIPFEGNEKLLGTTDMCPEEYVNW